MASEYGEVIDISDIQKAPRGATATYDEGLLDFLQQGLDADMACLLTTFTVARSDFPGTEDGKDAFQNERQRVGAVIRNHVEHLVAAERLPKGFKHSTNWHPEVHAPQVSRRK